jgi:hypothetical protein
MLPHLPDELWENIIAHVELPTDPFRVWTCGLAELACSSKRMHRLCTPKLFERVTLRCIRPRTVYNLISVMVRHPHIARSIREVTVHTVSEASRIPNDWHQTRIARALEQVNDVTDDWRTAALSGSLEAAIQLVLQLGNVEILKLPSYTSTLDLWRFWPNHQGAASKIPPCIEMWFASAGLVPKTLDGVKALRCRNRAGILIEHLYEALRMGSETLEELRLGSKGFMNLTTPHLDLRGLTGLKLLSMNVSWWVLAVDSAYDRITKTVEAPIRGIIWPPWLQTLRLVEFGNNQVDVPFLTQPLISLLEEPVEERVFPSTLQSIELVLQSCRYVKRSRFDELIETASTRAPSVAITILQPDAPESANAVESLATSTNDLHNDDQVWYSTWLWQEEREQQSVDEELGPEWELVE